MKNDEIKLIKELVRIPSAKITFNDNGYNSRVYIINNGEIVFKFPKSSNQNYTLEAAILNEINKIDSSVAIQKVEWLDKNNSYVGYWGVLGSQLDTKLLNDSTITEIGEKIGFFLKKLHQLRNIDSYPCSIKDEINCWISERYEPIKKILKDYFPQEDLSVIYELMTEYMPAKLMSLGEMIVFSHGDLGDENIIVNGNKPGIIDFTEAGYLDEAADFMDVSNELLCNSMLKGYSANNILREKVYVRRLIRPFIVLKIYHDENKNGLFEKNMSQCKENLSIYKNMKNNELM